MSTSLFQAALKKFGQAMETMPREGDEEEGPMGLKSSISLFPHQMQGLAWLLWRETQDPPGGILADDMGLGKTLTMLSLIVKHRELEETSGASKKGEAGEEWMGKTDKGIRRSKATLVICPASLLGQWEGEAKKRFKSGAIRTLVYHGTNRGTSARR